MPQKLRNHSLVWKIIIKILVQTCFTFSPLMIGNLLVCAGDSNYHIYFYLFVRRPPGEFGPLNTVSSLSVCLSVSLARNRFSRKPHIGFLWFSAWMLVLGSVKKWRFCFFQENSKIVHFGPHLSKIWAKMVKNAQDRRFSTRFFRKPHIGFP